MQSQYALAVMFHKALRLLCSLAKTLLRRNRTTLRRELATVKRTKRKRRTKKPSPWWLRSIRLSNTQLLQESNFSCARSGRAHAGETTLSVGLLISRPA